MNILNKTKDFAIELKKRNTILFYLGMGLTTIFLGFIVAFGIWNKPIDQIFYWLKPFKFSISFAIYVFTLGWFLEYLNPILGEKKVRQLSAWFALLITIEMMVIFLQGWQVSVSYASLQLSPQTNELIKSILSFFGNATLVINPAFAIYIASLFFRRIHLEPRSYLWGIRIGFVLFIFSCCLGGFLMLQYGHLPPNSNQLGMPFTQFGSVRDNLNSLHFLGIHSLQIFPLCGYYLSDFKKGKSVIFFSAGTYVCASVFFLLKAL